MITLGPSAVVICGDNCRLNDISDDEINCATQHSPNDGLYENWIYFYPRSRVEANEMSLALRLAANRLEAIGKRMA